MSEVDDGLIDPGLSGDNRPDMPASPLKLLVDTDGELLQVRMYKFNTWNSPESEGACDEDKRKLNKFPNGKYNLREDAWRVPLTDPNLEHLFTSWTSAQYQLTDAAKLFVDYHLKTRQLGDLQLEMRAKYLEFGQVPKPKDYEHCADFPPRSHQIVAYTSMVPAEYFALLMDMGTGKSKVAVDVICNRARRQRAKWFADNPDWQAQGVRLPQYRALIVAPKTVCFGWCDEEIGEFAKHATQDCEITRLRGKVLGRADQLMELLRDHDENGQHRGTPIVVAVINYEGMTDLKDVLRLVPWDIMILDESIKIKSQSAKRSKAAKIVGASAKSRAILTGLPITKDVKDLYSQFDFLKPGCLGYTTKDAFERRYCDSDGHLRQDMLPELQKMLSRISFVVKAEQCLDLPAKQYQTFDIEMADDQSDAYNSMLNQMIVDFEEMEKLDLKRLEQRDFGAAANKMMDRFDEAEKAVKSDVEAETLALDPEILARQRMGKMSVARIMLVQMLRLSQITSGFIKMADGSLRRFSSNPKLDALEEYFESIDTTTGGKVIVWAMFREDIRAIMERYAGPMNAVKIQGGMGDDAIGDAVRRFTLDDSVRLLVANPASGGQGLNLTKARHAIYYSQGWSLDHREQSEKRCHRLGQTGSVMYTDLIVPKSIDGIIKDRLKSKKDVADMLTDKGRIITALKSQLLARLEG